MNRVGWICSVVVLAALGIAGQAPAKQPLDGYVPDASLGNAGLDQNRSLIDLKLTNRLAAIEKHKADLQGFVAQMAKERSDFERHQAEEEKAYLLYLKSANADERDASWKQFLDKQAKQRADFDKNNLTKQQEWFQENIRDISKTQSLDMEPAAPAKDVAKVSMEPSSKPMTDAVSAQPAQPASKTAKGAPVKHRRKRPQTDESQ